jgi:uncharacterized membrane protein
MANIEKGLFVLTFLATLGCGLMAGVFFAFSAFVMKAFGRLPAAEGIAAMQSVNVAVLNPVFLSVFAGTAVACALLGISSVLRWNAPGAGWLLAGALLYLIGTFLVTAAFNVPRNEALAAVAPADPTSAGLWASYLATWTAWNHVRTAAALAAAASLIAALRS